MELKERLHLGVLDLYITSSLFSPFISISWSTFGTFLQPRIRGVITRQKNKVQVTLPEFTVGQLFNVLLGNIL